MKLITNLVLLTFLCLVSSKKDKKVNKGDNAVKVTLDFSLPSGFYTEETIQLEIKSSHPDAIIYYTIDSHNPNENSTLYEKPLILKNKSEEENVYCMITDVGPDYIPPDKKINKANIIRAIAMLPDGTFSDIYSGSYFVGLDKEKLYGDTPVVSLITDPDNFFDEETGIYVSGKTYHEWLAENPANAFVKNHRAPCNYNGKGKEYERPTTFQYIPGNKTTVDITHDLGIRIKGKASRSFFQKSFRLISRDDYGKKNLNYDIIPGNQRSDGRGPVTKYKSFNLRNGGNDYKHAKFRDNVLQSLITNDIFDNQQNDLAVVYLDGEYWGIYFIYEEYSDHYIANNYNIDNKNVAIIKSATNIEAGTQKDLDDFNETMNYIGSNDMTNPENYEKASKLLDLEGYAWASAFYAYTGAKDNWFRGDNYAMWRVINPVNNVKKGDGKWRLLMFDTEYSTGLYGKGKDYNDNVLRETFNSTFSNTKKLNSVVARSLVKNDEFKRMFVNALCDMKNINFESSRVNERIEDYRNRIVPLIDESYTRYHEVSSVKGDPVAAYNNKVDIFKTWLNQRQTIFMDQIKEVFNFEPAVNITITSNDFEKGSIVINNFNTLSNKYTGEYFTENILYVTGKPVKGGVLKSWSYKKCKYVSKNKNTIGFYPVNGCTITANFA
ncbi:hypothetical protein PIROE2DRAFT_11443 [Piromyces sp. E2]|nr:hypothetical protein PIROE2DRAFT_11443 [Piromyces sp. E2]|eukprot:OUM62295.1 hypothetical protein PIROE2DRAFT_11443 [Piromyces sp. E2]